MYNIALTYKLGITVVLG